MKSQALILGCDTETTGLDLFHGCRPFLFGGVDQAGKISLWRWRVDPLSRQVFVPNSEKLEVAEYLEAASHTSWWNMKFDIRGLELLGIPLPKDIWQRSSDGMIASHVLWSSGPHGLKERALLHLDITDDDEDELRSATLKARSIAKKLGWCIAANANPHWPAVRQLKTAWKADYWIPGELYYRRDDKVIRQYEIPDEWADVCETYAKRDFERTLGMYYVLQKQLSAKKLSPLYETRYRLLETTYKMESYGITVKRDRLPTVRKKHQDAADQHYREALIAVDNKIENLNSPKELQAALFSILKLPILKRTAKTGAPSTDKDVIEELRQSVRPSSRQAWFLKNLIGNRKRQHAADTIETYELGLFPEGNIAFGRLRPNVFVTGTDTTRFSYSNPNAQNVAKGEGLPKEEGFNLRELFGPLPGRIWYTHDYSNIELRIFACLAGEKEFLDAFARGESVHLLVAKELYPKIYNDSFKTDYPHFYQWVKNGNFSLIYGASPERADATYHVKGAYQIIRRRFKQIDSFMSSTKKQAVKHGYVETLGGYRLEVSGAAAHKAVNYRVQGSSGFAIGLAMVRIDKYLQTLKDHHLILQIHDELLTDAPDGNELNLEFPHKIKSLMELSGNDLGLSLPVEMGCIRESWDQESDVPPFPRVKTGLFKRLVSASKSGC